MNNLLAINLSHEFFCETDSWIWVIRDKMIALTEIFNFKEKTKCTMISRYVISKSKKKTEFAIYIFCIQ